MIVSDFGCQVAQGTLQIFRISIYQSPINPFLKSTLGILDPALKATIALRRPQTIMEWYKVGEVDQNPFTSPIVSLERNLVEPSNMDEFGLSYDQFHV